MLAAEAMDSYSRSEIFRTNSTSRDVIKEVLILFLSSNPSRSTDDLHNSLGVLKDGSYNLTVDHSATLHLMIGYVAEGISFSHVATDMLI